MKFDEAIKALITGAKITRKPWHHAIYFRYSNVGGRQAIHTYQPKLTNYVYNEDIMASDGWEVEGIEGKTWAFYDIIQFLQSGKRARLASWDSESNIHYDPQSQSLVYYTMEILPYLPTFDSFVANDWMIVE